MVALGAPTSGLGAGAGSPAAQAAAPTELPSARPPRLVKIGTIPTISDSPALIAEHRGYFATVGLQTELVPLSSGAEAIPALTTGQIDVGTAITPTVALVNAIQRGLALKAVASTGNSTRERWGSGFAISGALDHPVASLKDFTPPIRIATTGEGTLPQALAIILARRDGVPLSDLALVTMPLPDMIAALANGSIDVATTTEPFVALGERNGSAKRWHAYAELLPDITVGTVMFGESFLSTDRDAGERFLQAWLRGVRDYEDVFSTGRDADEILALIGGPTRTTPETFALFRQTRSLSFLPPDGRIDTRPWAEVVDVWKSQGLVGDFDARTLVDSSFAEKAVGRLGPYRPR